jgi:hypothetical protein
MVPSNKGTAHVYRPVQFLEGPDTSLTPISVGVKILSYGWTVLASGLFVEGLTGHPT